MTHTHTHTHTSHMQTHIYLPHTHTDKRIGTYLNIHICLYACTQTHMHTHMHTCTHTHANMHTCIHTYAHKYYTHTFTYKCRPYTGTKTHTDTGESEALKHWEFKSGHGKKVEPVVYLINHSFVMQLASKRSATPD